MHNTFFRVTAALLLATAQSVVLAQAGPTAVPPAPGGSQPTIDIPRPAPPMNARAVELWQDKSLGDLKASISLNLPETEKLSETEKVRLDQAAPILATSGYSLLLHGESRPWMLNSYEWDTPATRHLPLYFEEPNLERLGYRWGARTCWNGCEYSAFVGDGLQPFVSAVDFYGRVAMVPYLTGAYDPLEPMYTLGVDRPGTPVPYRRHYMPLSVRGALYQAGVLVGLSFAIP